MLNTHQEYGVTSRHIRCSSWDKRSTPYLVCIARFFFYSVPTVLKALISVSTSLCNYGMKIPQVYWDFNCTPLRASENRRTSTYKYYFNIEAKHTHKSKIHVQRNYSFSGLIDSCRCGKTIHCGLFIHSMLWAITWNMSGVRI